MSEVKRVSDFGKKRKYIKSGMYKKQRMFHFRPWITKFCRAGQWITSGVALAGIAYILIFPIPQYNPLVSIETTYAQVKNNDLINSNDNQTDQLDKRIEECWARNWQPMVLEQGFVCAAPAVEVSTK